MTPEVTIVIATYNAAETLSGALDSVMGQTFDDWECVVVDGASTDGTLDIVARYSALDPRIRSLSEPDRGIYDAFNKGWRAARGRWIYYLGSDDRLLPDGIPSLLAGATDADVVYGDVIIAFPNGSTKRYVSKNYHTVRHVMFCGHQSILMRRNAIEELGGFRLEYPIRADFDLVQRCYLNGGKFIYKNVAVAYFATTGASGRWSLKRDLERYRILKANRSCRMPMMWFGYDFIKNRSRLLIPRSVRLAMHKLRGRR